MNDIRDEAFRELAKIAAKGDPDETMTRSEVEALMASKLPCGHPEACAYHKNERGTQIGCAWCDDVASARTCLAKVNDIRNDIIACQKMNWSQHIYPLVAALKAAGIEGMDYPDAVANYGTTLQRAVAAEKELDALRSLLLVTDALRCSACYASDTTRLNDCIAAYDAARAALVTP